MGFELALNQRWDLSVEEETQFPLQVKHVQKVLGVEMHTVCLEDMGETSVGTAGEEK